AVLISMAQYYGIFGIFIAAWIFYQAFEAYHVAKARRDGDPLPDPLGLNEVGNWLHLGFQTEMRRPQGPPPPAAGSAAGAPGQAPPASGFAPAPGAYPAPHSNPYQSGYQPPPYMPPAAPYTPYAGDPSTPVTGFYGGYPPPPPAAGFAPGAPPMPPMHWKRREPIAAVILIALGVLFLLGQFSGRMMAFAWPVLLIGLGAWMIARRLPPAPAAAPGAGGGEPPAAGASEQDKDRSRRDEGGIL
ncbi:MAG: LiaF transmembrane domain-containing protein, partial [Acidobacteriota bacterium]